MATRKNILTACFAALLAIGLAACGGGSDQRPAPNPVDVDRTAINSAIDGATTAVDALTAMSSDDDVAAAQAEIDAAQTALDGTTVLAVTEVRELQAKITALRASLGAKQTQITAYRTHQSQLGAANTAVDAATVAVAGLSAMSSDDEVAAAKTAVTAAKAAVAAGTTLTASEMEDLNGKISTAETSLATKETQIADYRTHGNQYRAAMDAVDAAKAAVDALTAMSTDTEVMAADAAVAAAKAAVAAGTSLTASEMATLNGAITLAEANLTNKKTLVADRKAQEMRDQQHMMVSNAIDAANTAVDALTAMSSDDDVAAAQAAIDAARTALDGTTVLTSTDVLALQGRIAAAQTSLGAKRTAIANYRTHQTQHTAAMNAVDAAKTAVDGLTEMSSDDAVTDAEAAVAAAKTAVAAGTMLTDAEKATLNSAIALAESNLANKKTMIATRKAGEEEQRQRTAANNAVGAAEMAVLGLTEMSSDADVAEAQRLIDAAEAAVEETTALPASEVLGLQGRIAAAETALGTKRMAIADYRTHGRQLDEANRAVGAAEMAVAGLTEMSSDDDVAAARQAIADAKAAVTAGTMLTADEVAALNGKISTAETSLGTTQTAINNYRTHKQQLSDANTDVNAATMAVAGLTAMSDDDAVTAAENAITTAVATVAAGTTLTADEVAALNGKIALARVELGTKRTAIAAYREHRSAMNAVSEAEMAVAALTADSTDEAVMAAEAKITAAKKAVMDSMTLTDDQKAALNSKIMMAETDLGTVMEHIALRKVARLSGVARQETTAAMNAAEAAEQAVKDAKKYSNMLHVLKVGGDSGKATANAQKVLDARDAAIQAVRDAEAAKMRAETAKTAAEAIAEGTAGRTALITALDGAIKAAAGHVKTATDIRDKRANQAGSLASYVQVVTGTNADDPKTPAKWGKEVADLIYGALTTAAQTPAAVQMPSSHTVSAAVGGLVKGPSDAQGMTFEMIVDAVEDKRIASGAPTGTLTRAVKAKSVAGMKVTDFWASASIPTGIPATDGGKVNQGTEFDDASPADDPTYKGIQGVLFCAGSDCAVEGTGDDRRLVGSWYFTDDDNENTYLAGRGAAAGTYTMEAVTSYVRYGYWLSTASDTDDTTTINRYISGPTARVDADAYAYDTAVPGLRDTSATYRGNALGMSVLKTIQDGRVTKRDSGGFTADVELTMKFETTPTLGGTIDNFEGSAVDRSWVVRLKETGIDATTGGLTGGTGITNEDGTGANTNEGTWTATAWGGTLDDAGTTDVNEATRPVGVYGIFDAKFTNGDLAGVYATRKQ